MLRYFFAFFLTLLVAACATNGTRSAGPLDDWELSCGADAGSVRQVGDTWEFRTSANYCTGGTFNQRAEIFTEDYPTDREGRFLFTSNVSITTPVAREFSIFSIHDGRDGCAPPLQLFVRPDGRMYISSAVKTGPGESCIDGRIGGTSSGRMLRDGTQQELKVLVDFDGSGGFDVAVMLDGAVQITGSYTTPQNSNAIISERFYFKHGVYSKTVFDYVMKSRGLNVARVASIDN